MQAKKSHKPSYEKLWQYIGATDAPKLILSFAEIENILGFPIDHAFLNYKKKLHEYGWLCTKISMKEENISFLRLPEHSRILEKSSFSVIGKEGSTDDGPLFVQRLWDDANSQVDQIAALAKKECNGDLCGIWGLMSDRERQFKPWAHNFTEGLYLAGIECHDDAQPPQGWVRWTVPAFQYLVIMNESEDTFSSTVSFLKANKLSLAGAVHDFTDPTTGKAYLYIPLQKR